MKGTNIDGDLSVSHDVALGGGVTAQGGAHIKGSVKIDGWLDAPNIKAVNKGLFTSEGELNDQYPKPLAGWFAIVVDATDETKGFLYRVINKEWVNTSTEARQLQFLIDSANVYVLKRDFNNSNAELLSRLQGTSENSDSMKDSFVALTAGNSGAMAELLDATVAGGKYRITFGGNTLVELTVCEKYSGDILQSISGFIELRNYGIDVATKHNTLMRVKSAGVWSEWALVAGTDVVAMIESETTRAKDAETTLSNAITAEVERAEDAEGELLKRIQGTSDASNAMKDPFKSLGIINSIEEMLTLLDSLCSNVAGTNDYGKFRINLNGVNVYVTNYVLGRDYQVFAQEIYAPIEIRSVVDEEKSYLTADESAASYVHITRKYAQELKLVTNWRATGSSRTLRRTHHKDNGWSNWVDISNPYIASPLYGKNILLIGGSFAHNMRAFSGGLGFTIDKKDYSMQNYLAEQLGLNHLDNFAIQGEGSCITAGVFLKRNTLEQFKLAAQKATENGYSYDAIILVGGLNDFQKSVPVGKLSDATTAGTFCAGLKALANEIRTTYSTAKILFTTPFKCTRTEPWEDAFWNPLSKKTNSADCRFAEYIQAIKEVAHLRSIPLLDIYSICQIDTHNAGKLLLSDLVHPNGQGYLTVAPAMLDFIAWQKGAAVFSNEALQMNLKQELGEQIEDNASKILQNTGNIDKLDKSINSKETELLARIQGTSDASNAMKDPFKFVGNYNTATLDKFRAWLDSLHGADYTLDNRGVYRVVLNDAVIEIISSPIEYTKERYKQVVKGRVSIESTSGLITSSAEFNLLERTHNIDNGWSAWRVVASADTLETLNNAITAETARAEKAETFLTPVPNTYWKLVGAGEKSVLKANVLYKSIIIPVREGDKFIITAEGDGSARTWGTLNENKVVLRYADNYPQTNAKVTIAVGESYLVVNCETGMTWDVRTTSTAADILQQFVVVEDRATEKGRQLTLRDLCIAAGAEYNDTDKPITRTAPWGEEVQHLAGHYYLNGLGNLTHVEMAKIYSFIGWEPRAKCRRGLQSFSLPRTLFKGISTSQNREFWNSYVPELGFYGNTSIVVLPYGDLSYNGTDGNLMPLSYQYQSAGHSLKYFCGGCRNLRAIGTISATYIKNFGTGTEAAFYDCSKLEFVNICSLNVSITLASSPLFSKKSLLYIITNAKPTSAITITLHPDAYARLAEDSEIVEALTAQPLVTLVSA